MATAQLQSAPPAFAAVPANSASLRTTLAHTWFLTGRKLHALVRQP